MPNTSRLFLKMGFDVWQVPGVSRAWRRDCSDGSFVLVTDLGGYDLPEPGGPYSGISLSRAHELIEVAPILRETKILVRWLHHLRRLQTYRSATVLRR